MSRQENIETFRTYREGFEEYNKSGQAYRELVADRVAKLRNVDDAAVAVVLDDTAAEMWAGFQLDAWDEAYQAEVDSGALAERYAMRSW